MTRAAADFTNRTLGAAGALVLPLRADALYFGLAGVFGLVAGIAWSVAQAGLHRLPEVLG